MFGAKTNKYVCNKQKTYMEPKRYVEQKKKNTDTFQKSYGLGCT